MLILVSNLLETTVEWWGYWLNRNKNGPRHGTGALFTYPLSQRWQQIAVGTFRKGIFYIGHFFSMFILLGNLLETTFEQRGHLAMQQQKWTKTLLGCHLPPCHCGSWSCHDECFPWNSGWCSKAVGPHSASREPAATVGPVMHCKWKKAKKHILLALSDTCFEIFCMW